MNRNVDIVCVGEALIDFIGEQLEHPIKDTKDYHRYLGGSPTNVAMNMCRLGLQVEMVATVGKDGLGHYIVNRLREAKVCTSHLRETSKKPTTVIFISRTQHTPEFIAFRGADTEITPEQLPDALLQQTRIYHTTCFALSKKPARDTLLMQAKRAKELGCQLSIDINYSEKIWPNNASALKAIETYCSFGPLVKVSQDDVDRLFGKGLTHEKVFAILHGMGAQLICFTLGKEGAKLSQKGQEVIALSALKVEKIMDATGAGDAFWSGFLFAYLKGKSNEKCMEAALQMAAIKLQNVGRIPDYADVISKVLGI
ncbi:MAG TPA: PfkB family carbohydrate kinase [Flavobacteriaceae bacterium]|nr:carbohydrate kinase [Flavobacteriaceae bacterium]MCB9213919.1 carbohydrate kinase [Alteromonas sp.]HPF11096.1 PfkB family carbohydrate kinase [Flavobacteriaceae bacterium]HQU21236.1 PfkB family carbohydrate kinase [Flavobacteriaceae bacterium]HQU65708.1 PfkB family carbohydrate kinase [Flavobacteriaceae bacterium]